jgi:hypothetical protein
MARLYAIFDDGTTEMDSFLAQPHTAHCDSFSALKETNHGTTGTVPTTIWLFKNSNEHAMDHCRVQSIFFFQWRQQSWLEQE